MLFNSWWHEPPNMKQSNTLQKIQYLNYITGIPVLYNILITLLVYQYCTKFWKKKSQYWNKFLYQYCAQYYYICIPVLRSPSTGDPDWLPAMELKVNNPSTTPNFPPWFIPASYVWFYVNIFQLLLNYFAYKCELKITDIILLQLCKLFAEVKSA